MRIGNINQRTDSSWGVRVWRMYYDGFRTLTPLGKRLWLLILIKLAIFFGVLRLFFFPDVLDRDYDNDADRAQAVRTSLTQPGK